MFLKKTVMVRIYDNEFDKRLTAGLNLSFKNKMKKEELKNKSEKVLHICLLSFKLKYMCMHCKLLNFFFQIRQVGTVILKGSFCRSFY